MQLGIWWQARHPTEQILLVEEAQHNCNWFPLVANLRQNISKIIKHQRKIKKGRERRREAVRDAMRKGGREKDE